MAEEVRLDTLERAHRNMNSNLIFTLLHYKIFVAQPTAIKRLLGYYNVVAHVLVYLIPLLARFHQPYVSQVSLGNLSTIEIKIIAIAASIAPMPLHLACCWPLCVLLARCKTLYKDLSGLLAHTTEVRSSQSGERVYDSHAEISLIRELSDPKGFVDQLTVSYCGFKATHTVLIKAYFWLGLIIISIMSDDTDAHNGQDPFSWFFTDPLRVFS